jgi:ABC-type transport system involved in cytochrome c biogenesis permease subunit
VPDLHAATAVLYLAAGLAAGAAYAGRAPRLGQAALVLLAAGAVLHGLAFVGLHLREPVPSLTTLPAALSLMAWLAVLFFLWLGRRARLAPLVLLLAPAAFLATFFAARSLPGAEPPPVVGGSWPHAHVLLASAGLALLAVAGFAGLMFLVEHRALKSKRPAGGALRLPSLEALDRVNVLALALGFPLLTLGVITGMLWVQGTSGRMWTGTAHQTSTAVAWVVYALLVAARFGRGQGSREAALAAVGGFVVLLFAVVGVGLLS